MLKRYWITFETIPNPTPLNLGCGVTAQSRDDALDLLNRRVFSGSQLPKISAWIENVDVSTLSKKVQPNIGDVTVRGIWFPLGFES